MTLRPLRFRNATSHSYSPFNELEIQNQPTKLTATSRTPNPDAYPQATATGTITNDDVPHYSDHGCGTSPVDLDFSTNAMLDRAENFDRIVQRAKIADQVADSSTGTHDVMFIT